jgi:hypothetical protein
MDRHMQTPGDAATFARAVRSAKRGAANTVFT